MQAEIKPLMTEPSAIERLLRPRSVAIVGASTDASKTAGRPVAYLQSHGFAGGIYPINPRANEIGGLRCYADVASLPETPDVGIVLVGPERAADAVRDLSRRGTAAAIVLAGGYGETGEDGARRQRELKLAAGSMRLLGPNTIGLVNLTDRIMLSASSALEIDDLPAGRVSVVSQSGGILGSLLSRAADRGIGLARLVSTGNEADIDCCDIVDYLADDPATGVIALYLEGLRSADKFRNAAKRAADAGKPIVVYKIGRSESGARSAMSHTGALAGADRLYDAFFRQLGVIRVDSFSDLLDVPAALVQGRRLAGNRIAVLTSTGGAAALIADRAGLAGIELPDPDTATAATLARLLDDEQAAAHRNPVDITLAGIKPDIYRGAIDALLAAPGYDGAVIVVGSSALANPTLAADAILECQARSTKPVLAFVSPHAPHIVALLNRKGIPAFASPEGCAAGLASLLPVGREFGDRRLGQAERDPASTGGARHAGSREGLAPAYVASMPTGPLDEAESKALFAHFGLAGVREIAAATPDAAASAAREIGEPVVVKVLSRHIAHKSDIGGVRIGVAAADVVRVATEMSARVKTAGLSNPDGFLVQSQVTGGLEMILGFLRDPQLGPAVLLGMGGIAAELVGDTSVRMLPISRADAAAMIAELKTSGLLSGYRGAAKRDVPALVDAILAFAGMAEALGDGLLEAEVNPLFVLPDGQGVLAADGLVVLGESVQHVQHADSLSPPGGGLG